MNREEAIKIFQLMKKILSIPNSDAARTIEAIDMAIEALSVANLKEEFESAVPNCQKCAIKELWEATEKEDLVEVVRCKDCRHAEHRKQMPNQVHCKRDKLSTFCALHDDDDFCKYGERKE